MKRIFYLAILALMVMVMGIDTKYVYAEEIDLENDIIIDSEKKDEKSPGSSRVWDTYGDFKTLKTNGGYTYSLFHDFYVEDLAMNKDVHIYFDLTNVTNSTLKSDFKSVISTFGNLNNSKIKMYTVSKPTVKYYTVTVKDYNNGADCGTSSTVLACAGRSSFHMLKEMTESRYTQASRKAIIMHELLHVLGINHTAQNASGTVMAPVITLVNTFNLNTYYNDVSAWHTLNEPFRVTTETISGVKYKFKKFININIEEKHQYESSGKYWIQSMYYRNGKNSKKIMYPGTLTNKILSEHLYESTGNYWKESIYYKDGKKVKKVVHPGTITNGMLSEHFYEPTGRYWKESLYYENGKKVKKVIYAGTEENPIIEEIYYD